MRKRVDQLASCRLSVVSRVTCEGWGMKKRNAKKQKNETSKREKPSLQALVARITPQNRHPEVDWGKPRGREVW